MGLFAHETFVRLMFKELNEHVTFLFFFFLSETLDPIVPLSHSLVIEEQIAVQPYCPLSPVESPPAVKYVVINWQDIFFKYMKYIDCNYFLHCLFFFSYCCLLFWRD